jgi:V/A-type H+-transporting ATPase subunit A
MTEPVTSHTERFVRCLWSLDRDLAYARHYPAVTWRQSFSRDVPTVAAWHEAAGRSGWAKNRARAVALLADADRLAPMVELVGLQALPAHERIVVLVGRLFREAVLQQSALSANDATSTPEKQAALLEMVLAIDDRCEALIARGIPAGKIEELDLSDVVRARDEVAPDDADGVSRRADEILASLDAWA